MTRTRRGIRVVTEEPVGLQATCVADDEELRADLRTVGIRPEDVRFRLVEVDLPRLSSSGAEGYLLDGDEEGYVRCLEMADALAAGEELPPVIVWSANAGPLEVLGGHHRLAAHVQAGRTTVRAYEVVRTS